MPQPITKIVQNPHVYLDNNILADKSDMAILVTNIFATWARIEQELNFLLVHILGAEATPAIAMFQTLTAQHLQLGALEAAAKAALSAEDFEIFLAALSTADSAQTPRNHLAHWAWGGCKQRPDLLVLANPKMLRERDFRVAKGIVANLEILQIAELNLFDNSQSLAYSKPDLQRALRDLREAHDTVHTLAMYLDPAPMSVFSTASEEAFTQDQIRALAFQSLNGKRLFREALARIRADQQSTQQAPPGSPLPEPDGS
jgi:hypothetical protein